MSESLPPPRKLGTVTEAISALLVVAFAFLSASFAVRNADFWLHLATGRLLARGEYAFGVDPFCYTTTGAYWANHSWLFDLALYAGRQLVGEAGLAGARAVLTAVLAGLMLSFRRRDPQDAPAWPALLCTLLAVLALSPRLLLQPALVSCFLLLVVLVLLSRGGRALWAVPVVQALWVNLDSWFVLGPVAVALFALGQLRQPADKRVPLWLLLATLAACLASPYHVFGLRLPAELSPALWRGPLRGDPRFAPLFASPWRLDLLGTGGDVNLSGWAFFLLLGLGALSFLLSPAGRRDWRLPVWLFFAALAAWQVRLVSFFAVVAGPVTALNMQDSLADLSQASRERKRPEAAVAGLVAVAALLLCALCWPGWLQGFQREDRRLAWEVTPDPALVRTAKTLASWRQQGLLAPDAHVFTFHPDVVPYLAWFAQGERGFLDARLELFSAQVTTDFLALSRVLDPSLPAREDHATASEAVQTYGLVCAVLYDPDVRRLGPALREAVGPEASWPMSRVEGKSVLLAHRSSLPSFDPRRLAYGDEQDILPEAPGEGPSQDLERARWLHFLHPPGPPSWESDAAAVYLRAFDDSAGWQQKRQLQLVAGRWSAGLVGLAALPGAGMDVAGAVLAEVRLQGVFLSDLDERPPELPLLAVRAARGAVARQPTDANAWMLLGQAYFALGRNTVEGVPGATLPTLRMIRDAQIATSCRQALACRPDLLSAHEALAQLYTERQFLDLALRHRREQLRLARARGPLAPREDQAAFAERIGRMQEGLDALQREVEDGEFRFAARAQPLAAEPLARAQLALQLGLAGKALDDVLLRSHPDLYRVEGLRLLLELLLLTGRAQDARDLLDRTELRGNPEGLGLVDLPGVRPDGLHWAYRLTAYDWFDLCQSAAAGDYGRADDALGRLRERLRTQGGDLSARLPPVLAVRVATEVGLAAAPAALSAQFHARLEREQAAGWVVQSQFLPVELADLHALEAVLLLERGRPAGAREHFSRALRLYRRSADSSSPLPGLPLTLRYLERMGQAPGGTGQ